MRLESMPPETGRNEAVTLSRGDGDGPSIPLWVQLRGALVDIMHDLSPHALLPSESALCRRFGVSRTVVREALNQLVVERRVYKMQGKGSFVADMREEQNFVGSKISFSADFVGKQHVVTSRVLRQVLCPATERQARLMRLEDPDKMVVMLDRLLIVDGEPRTYLTVALRASAMPGMETVAMENRQLYDTMQRKYGIVLDRAERWIEAATATPEIAAHLNVPEGAPLLRIESISSDESGVPMEFYLAYHRTDRARLHFVVK